MTRCSERAGLPGGKEPNSHLLLEARDACVHIWYKNSTYASVLCLSGCLRLDQLTMFVTVDFQLRYNQRPPFVSVPHLATSSRSGRPKSRMAQAITLWLRSGRYEQAKAL